MKTTKRDKILNALDKVTDGVEEILNSMKIESNPDPHRELREAQERGEVVECLQSDGKWHSYEPYMFNFNQPPDRYRIKPPEYNCRVKPKTVKRKLYKWAYQKDTRWHESKQFYEYTPQGLIVKYNSINAFRIDSTMIEVEV